MATTRTRSLEIATPGGPARAHLHPAAPRRGQPVVTLVLGHGAGGGVDARDLVALAEALPPLGAAVVLVEQPWRVAGRRVAAPPPRLDEAWTAVLADEAVRGAGRLVVGGRSAGARVACRTAGAVGADSVVCLAFPLHPPGRPDRSRAGELLGAGVPVLVVQGDRDAFGGPAELPSGASAPWVRRVAAVPYADHGFAVPTRAPVTQAEAMEVLVSAVASFVLRG